MNGRPDITCFLAVYRVWRRSGLLLQTHAHSSNEFGYAAHLVLCDKERKGLIGLAIGYWFGLATKGLSWTWLVRSQLMYFTNCCIGCLDRANWRCLTSTRLVCTTVHQELTNLESRVHIRMRSGRTGYVQKWVMYLNPQFFPIWNIRLHKRLCIHSNIRKIFILSVWCSQLQETRLLFQMQYFKRRCVFLFKFEIGV